MLEPSGKIQKKMGLVINFPLTKVMVLSIVAYHMEKADMQKV